MMLKKMLTVFPVMLCALAGRSESIASGDFTYSYSLSTKEGIITKYNGSSESVVIPSMFSVPETYRDNDGETHTRHHTITVTAIDGSVLANKKFSAFVSFHNKLEFIGLSLFRDGTSIAEGGTNDTDLKMYSSAEIGERPDLSLRWLWPNK